MDIRAQFGLTLQRLRRDRKFSQETLAADTEIDRAYIGRLERGEANPTLVLMARIALCLDVSVADLARDIRADLPEAIPQNKPKPRRRRRKPSR